MLRRAVVPSSATTSSPGAAKAATQRPQLAANASGSSRRRIREKVSWPGTPPSRRRKRRRNGSSARPNRAMPTQLSAPHSIAASAISRIANRSWRRSLPVRGSARSSKPARNRSMPPSSRHTKAAAHQAHAESTRFYEFLMQTGCMSSFKVRSPDPHRMARGSSSPARSRQALRSRFRPRGQRGRSAGIPGRSGDEHHQPHASSSSLPLLLGERTLAQARSRSSCAPSWLAQCAQQ